jgi:septum formation protein
MSTLWLHDAPIVLASGSAARRMLLEGCGIPFEVIKPHVDEKAIAAALLEERRNPCDIAIALAHAKAEAVAGKVPDRIVLAADQTLDHRGTLFMKPVDFDAARAQLTRLRGDEHQLHSAAVLRRGEKVLWSGVASAALVMRDFSDSFLDAYLAAMGGAVLDTVGGYQLEALGPHLFSEIVGDQATILGLPLFGVLWSLRDQGLLQA